MWQSPGFLAVCKTPPQVYFCQSGTLPAPHSLLRNEVWKVKGLPCSQSEKASPPLWPTPSGHLVIGQLWEKALEGSCRQGPPPWPLDRPFFLARLPPLTFLRQPLSLRTSLLKGGLISPPLGHHLPAGKLPPLTGRRPQGMSVSARQGGRAPLGILHQGAGLPTSHVRGPPPATSRKHAAGLWVTSAHCPNLPHLPGLCPGHSGLSLLSPHVQSTAPPRQQASEEVIREMRPTRSLPAQGSRSCTLWRRLPGCRGFYLGSSPW